MNTVESLGFIHPKKKWGQNFLIDPNIREKILSCAGICAGETVIEIGPGRGILTKALLDRAARVTAIEIDRDLIAVIRKALESPHDHGEKKDKLTLIHGDALDYDYQNISSPYKVVANLPYNISTPMLFRLLKEKNRISRMVLMLQREVAERISSSVRGKSVGDKSSGSKKSYGALSIIIQYYADVRTAFFVSPDCFRPRPKVGSAVIVLEPLPSPRIPVRDEALFLRIIKGAFQHRRKRLANALSCAGFDGVLVKSVLEQINCDPKRRGETLSMSEFASLSDAMSLRQ